MSDVEQDTEIGIDAPIDGNDWLIQNVVKIAEAGAGISLTLTTPGGIVSGRVITSEDYFQKLSDAFRSSGDTEVHGVLAEWASSFKAVASAAMDPDGPYFIHLEEASFDLPGGARGTSGLWRGKISAISAIVFGVAN